jgi:multiple sugar transport system permease protein
VRRLASAARWAGLVAAGLVTAFPLYWTVTIALKPPSEWVTPGTVHWLPRQPTLENFEAVLGLSGSRPHLGPEGGPDAAFYDLFTLPNGSALRPLTSSLVAATGGTAMAVLIGSLAAYGVVRFGTGGQRRLAFPFLLARIAPPLVLLIPILILFFELGLFDTLVGLILVYGAITSPLVFWLLRGFLLDVPRELPEAAIVEGCSHWGALFKVVLPQVRHGFVATALFTFVVNWSDFTIALALSQDALRSTAPVYLAHLTGFWGIPEYGPQAALALILIVPPVLLGLLAFRYLTRGFTLGAVRS